MPIEIESRKKKIEFQQVRPELIELKEYIISRIPQVTIADARERIHSIISDLCSHGIDVGILCRGYGLSLHGLDVPQRINLIPLYSEVEPEVVEGLGTVFSFPLGLRRMESDPKSGKVTMHWAYLNHPEKKPHKYVTSYDVTYFAKYHVITPDDGEPFLFINPIQSTRFLKESHSEVKEEFEREIEVKEKDDAKRVKKVKHKMRLLENPHATVFEHNDRNLVLALPSHSLIIQEVEKFYPTLARGMREPGIEMPFQIRYKEIEELISRAPGFRIFEWNG